MGYIASTRSLRKFPSLVWISSLPSVRLLNSFESHDPPIFYHTLSLRLNFDSSLLYFRRNILDVHTYYLSSVSPVEEISSRRPSIPSETRLVGRKLIRAGGERERDKRDGERPEATKLLYPTFILLFPASSPRDRGPPLARSLVAPFPPDPFHSVTLERII